MKRPDRRFERLSQPEAAAAGRRPGSTVIWPLGACEQHGPQLPLITDALFAERILDEVLNRLPPDCPVWRLPVQAIGFSPEHGDFPGTLSLPADLLMRVLESVGSQLAAMGFQRLVLFNAHGGQIALLQVAARQLRCLAPSMAVLPCFIWSGVSGLSDLLPDHELKHGLHAGLAETSLMLAMEPSLVASERPADGDHSSAAAASTPPEGWSLEGHAPMAWFTADLSASGVVGDSRDADIALGRQLQTQLIRHWKSLFTRLLESSWPPLADPRRI